MKYEKSCGAIIYKYEENSVYLLMVMHINGGHWSFPKGHVENDETEPETAIREIKEETGLDVVIDTSFRQVVTYSPRNGVTKDVVYFAAVPVTLDFVPQKEEISKIKWVSLNEAENTVTFDNDKKLVKLFTHYIADKK